MTMSSLMNVFQKLFRGEKKAKPQQSLSPFNDDSCPKCGSMDFSYDSYWKESCCKQCGWIIDRQKSKEVSQEPSSNLCDPIFSYSKVSLFEKCPKAYNFKYMLKKSELFSTIEQHLGKSVHSAIKDAYTERDAGNKISLSSLIKAYRQAWDSPESKNIKVVKKNTSLEDYFLTGQNMLKKFYQRILIQDKSETVALEKYFEINLNNNICYRGFIDRISKEPNGKLRITDFKTGKRVNEPKKDLQLCSYALWLFDESKENEIEIVFEALMHDKAIHNTLKKLQMSSIQENLLTSINNIIFTRSFKANPSPLCGWCGYKPLCKDSGGYY